MNTDDVCTKERLPFLRYLNAQLLFYSITLLVFAAVFLLAWILKKYTFFDKNKHKVPQGILPKFPYGNFKDVVNQEISLHEFLWKFYNRFKKKGYKYGGLFLFTKPVILVTDAAVIQNINKNHKAYTNIYPSTLKTDTERINKIFKTEVVKAFLEKYNCSLKGTLAECFKNNEAFTALRNGLLESTCLAFGFKSSEMIEEINQVIKESTNTSFRYYFSLSYPLFKKSHHQLTTNLIEIFLETMDNRKKNDVDRGDLIQSFVDIYNESSCVLEDIVNDIFDIFSSMLTHSYSTTLLCLYELAKNADIQEDVVGEIRRYNRKNLPITNENLNDELTYLDAVIKETLRKYPPVPTVSKFCCADQESGPQLPKNTIVFISPLATHRDPQNYTKPDEFDPDRFTEEHHYVKPNAFIPFGVDSRHHIDMQFTTLQVKLTLIGIFSSLRVTLKDGGPDNLKIDPKLLCLGVCENFSLKFDSL